MKKNLLTTLLLFISFYLQAQVLQPLDHPRGLYVNRFFSFNSGTITQNTNTSILGNAAKENELLQYCMDNHITYLTLFDVPKIFSTFGTPQWTTNSNLLSRYTTEDITGNGIVESSDYGLIEGNVYFTYVSIHP